MPSLPSALSALFRRRAILLGALLLGSTGALSAQTTLFTTNFESDTVSSLPTGWSGTQPTVSVVTANPSAFGINTSANVLSFTTAGSYATLHTPAIDVPAVGAGATYTLSFDLYDPTYTNTHGTLIGFGSSTATGPTAWAITSSGADTALGSTATHIDDLTTAGVWQHFSFNVTNDVAASLTAGTLASQLSIFVEGYQYAPYSSIGAIDNITLTATSAVPEPSTYAELAGLAALCFVMVRRRFGSRS